MKRKNMETEATEDSSQLQHAAEHTSPQRHSVFLYLTILALVAFALLLIAYFQQQRNNAAAIDSLQQSHSAVESLEHLLEEREQLKNSNTALENQVAELENQLAQAKKESEALRSDVLAAQAQTDALNLLSQVRNLYNHSRFQEARDIILQNSEMEAALEKVSRAMSDEARENYDPLEAFRLFKDWLNVE